MKLEAHVFMKEENIKLTLRANTTKQFIVMKRALNDVDENSYFRVRLGPNNLQILTKRSVSLQACNLFTPF